MCVHYKEHFSDSGNSKLKVIILNLRSIKHVFKKTQQNFLIIRWFYPNGSQNIWRQMDDYQVTVLRAIKTLSIFKVSCDFNFRRRSGNATGTAQQSFQSQHGTSPNMHIIKMKRVQCLLSGLVMMRNRTWQHKIYYCL